MPNSSAWEAIKPTPKNTAMMEFKEETAELIKESESLDFKEFYDNVRGWSTARGFADQHPHGQALKFGEEGGEVFAGLARSDLDRVMDGIGDIIVVSIIMVQQMQNILIDAGQAELAKELTHEKAFGLVWNEIKDRKGKVVNGIFVKEEPIKEG